VFQEKYLHQHMGPHLIPPLWTTVDCQCFDQADAGWTKRKIWRHKTPTASFQVLILWPIPLHVYDRWLHHNVWVARDAAGRTLRTRASIDSDCLWSRRPHAVSLGASRQVLPHKQHRPRQPTSRRMRCCVPLETQTSMVFMLKVSKGACGLLTYRLQAPMTWIHLPAKSTRM
jgi:hypothetical protein